MYEVIARSTRNVGKERSDLKGKGVDPKAGKLSPRSHVYAKPAPDGIFLAEKSWFGDWTHTEPRFSTIFVMFGHMKVIRLRKH